MNNLTLTAPGDGVYTVNLTGYTPPPRYGDTVGPWSSVRVEEAAGEAGPWGVLASGSLSPQDQDPKAPASWRFTVAGAALARGWYRVVWLDGQGDEQPTEARYNGPPVRPNVKDIARLLPGRATLDGGAKAYTFNDVTNPAGDEVDGLIDIALDQVLIEVPPVDTLDGEQVAQVRGAVGYLAAVLVENAHFMEQVESGDSLAAMYQAFYDKAIAQLAASINDNMPGSARFGSLTITSPTTQGWSWASTELLP